MRLSRLVTALYPEICVSLTTYIVGTMSMGVFIFCVEVIIKKNKEFKRIDWSDNELGLFVILEYSMKRANK